MQYIYSYRQVFNHIYSYTVQLNIYQLYTTDQLYIQLFNNIYNYSTKYIAAIYNYSNIYYQCNNVQPYKKHFREFIIVY